MNTTASNFINWYGNLPPRPTLIGNFRHNDATHQEQSQRAYPLGLPVKDPFRQTNEKVWNQGGAVCKETKSLTTDEPSSLFLNGEMILLLDTGRSSSIEVSSSYYRETEVGRQRENEELFLRWPHCAGFRCFFAALFIARRVGTMATNKMVVA